MLIWDDCGAATGVGGSGLFVSELSVRLIGGGGVGSVAAKLSKDTVCGCLCVTSFPCRCLGAGGGFFLPFFTSETSPMLSSSSESAISTDVRGESAWDSCMGSNSDCRETEDVSVLLLVSNCAPATGCDALVDCCGGPDGRGVAFPVRSRFLKLSTSKEALLLPSIGLPVFVRSSSLSLSWGSNEASVLENGFAGTLPGDCIASDSPKVDLGFGDASAIAMASFPTTWALASPAVTELLTKPAGVTGGGGLAGRPWLDRRAMSSFKVASESSKMGGGIVVVGERMRTDFLVLPVDGGAASSSTVRQLLLECQQTQKGKAREYHGRCPPCALQAHCYPC